MILGNICTRNCSFCGINKGNPLPPDPDEPKRIVNAVKKLGLDYVVITSVTRDDLADGGAHQFALVIKELLKPHSPLGIEVLIPDFQGNTEALKTVLDAKPLVINHNIETVPRLYPSIRPQANYQQSLNLLLQTKSIKRDIVTKSGFMVGLGETKEEIETVLCDLRAVNCNIVTIGQYLPPSKSHPKAERYVNPEEFNEYIEIGERLGIKVAAGPFVRSSYQASKLVRFSSGVATSLSN